VIQDLIHRQIVQHRGAVSDWFSSQSRGLYFPFYSSFDIRDSSFKVAPVDANVFPAGFNNICATDQETAVEIVAKYFRDHYPDCHKIVLLTEEHTQNPYYWDNIKTLRDLIEAAGRTVELAMPKEMDPLKIKSASGAVLKVHSAYDLEADLIISNNDFSKPYPEWMDKLEIPITPPHQLGWHQRRKDSFFREYNDLATAFCKLIGIDPWLMQVDTEVFSPFDITDDQSIEKLAVRVDQSLLRIRRSYQEHSIIEEPFVFIKNNSGTYGLGITQVNSGDDVRQWNYKTRKKMKAVKGGGEIRQVIIQEGIPTTLKAEEATAEPTIYMIGCQLVGGFLRTHESKGPKENLNSPGAVFRRLCVSDLNVSVEGHPMENVYGWAAKLGFLAIAREAKNLNITCTRFRSLCQ